EPDEVAGEQRAEPGYPAKSNAGLDDPELRILDHQARRAFVDLCSNFHLGMILGKLHRRHLANVHVLVLDKGLAGFDSLGTLEDDADGRALAHDALDRDPDSDYRGNNRDQPDDRNP